MNGEPHLDDEVDAEEADKLEVDFEEKFYKQRAFADHPEADRMRAVADYSDKRFSLEENLGSFNVFYVCTAGAVLWPCNTVISAMEWDRLHDDVTATKQRWYCKECGAKYKTKYGVTCEIIMGEKAFYALAELPRCKSSMPS